jgi:hypothetical protein
LNGSTENNLLSPSESRGQLAHFVESIEYLAILSILSGNWKHVKLSGNWKLVIKYT